MKLLITTQVYENYAFDEDGVLGTGINAYWKPKGGNDYIIKNFLPRGLHTLEDSCKMAVMALREKIECDNEAYREIIIDWVIVEDDYMTEFEKSQLEYEGKITFPAIELKYA